jgi:hypothetical protein
MCYARVLESFCIILCFEILLLDIVFCLFIFQLFFSNDISFYLRMKTCTDTLLLGIFTVHIFFKYIILNFMD